MLLRQTATTGRSAGQAALTLLRWTAGAGSSPMHHPWLSHQHQRSGSGRWWVTSLGACRLLACEQRNVALHPHRQDLRHILGVAAAPLHLHLRLKLVVVPGELADGVRHKLFGSFWSGNRPTGWLVRAVCKGWGKWAGRHSPPATPGPEPPRGRRRGRNSSAQATLGMPHSAQLGATRAA